jgi:hypothetical protein
VWLDFARDGFRVTHLRPVLKNRLADPEGVALLGAIGGLVAAVVCWPATLMMLCLGLRTAVYVLAAIAVVGTVMALVGWIVIHDDILVWPLYVVTVVVISPLLLIPGFRKAMEYTALEPGGPPVWVPATRVPLGHVATVGRTTTVTLTFDNGGTVEYQASGRHAARMYRSFNRLFGPRLATRAPVR